MASEDLDCYGGGVSLARGDAASAEAFAQMQATFGKTVVVDSGLPGIDTRMAFPRHFRRPIITAAPDGVGTKLIYAAACGIPGSVGIDLVAMCADDQARWDIIPISFSVYRGTNTIDPEVFAQVTKGVVEGCKLAGGIPYISGETAEMPGFYVDSHYELVGVCNGVHDFGKLRRGGDIRDGDLLVSLPSKGGGSNGFGEIRLAFPPDEVAAGRVSLTPEEVLRPTPIYTVPVLKANAAFPSIRGWAHITGGGLGERGKLAHILPAGLCATLDRKSWEVPVIFRKVQEVGGTSDKKMFSIFNMGLMMVAVVSKKDAARLVRFLEGLGYAPSIVGRVEKQKGTKKVVVA